MREEYRGRLANEYRYTVTKMQEVKEPAKKLFYFSVLFGDAQRILNWEWNRDLALVYSITNHLYTQFNMVMQTPGGQIFPIDWSVLFEELTKVTSDLATYFEKAENKNNKAELYEILGRFAEIAYAVSGNGSYLSEKGAFKI
jgi:hypothetical protein